MSTELRESVDKAVDDYLDNQPGAGEGDGADDEKDEAKDKDTGDGGAGDTGDTGDTGAGEDTGEDAGTDTGEQDGPGDGDADTGDTQGDEEENYPDDELLARAISAGMSFSDAVSLNADSLNHVVGLLENRTKQAEKNRDSDDEGDTEDDPFASLPKLSADDYEPEVVKTFEKLTDIVKKQGEQLKQFQEQQQQVTQQQQAAYARNLEQWFDTQVENLGEDFADSLGTGAYAELDRGSAGYANREAIADQMAVLLSGYGAQGKNPPPPEQLFKTAARIVLGDVFQQKDTGKLADSVRKQKHIQRAGGSKAKQTVTPEGEAAQALKDMYGI